MIRVATSGSCIPRISSEFIIGEDEGGSAQRGKDVGRERRSRFFFLFWPSADCGYQARKQMVRWKMVRRKVRGEVW